MIEALADGGVLAGLSRDLAAELAARVVLVSVLCLLVIEMYANSGRLDDGSGERRIAGATQGRRVLGGWHDHRRHSGARESRWGFLRSL